MSTQEIVTRAAKKGVRIYKAAIHRNIEDTNAYIKGLDYIIDIIYKGDMFGEDCQKAIQLYEKEVMS